MNQFLAKKLLHLHYDNPSHKQIKSAWKSQIRKHHPDLHNNSKESHKKCIMLNKAYTFLIAEYDYEEYPTKTKVKFYPFDSFEDECLFWDSLTR